MLSVRVITPSEELFSGSAQAVFLPGTLGEFEILPHHAPIVASLVQGDVKLRLSDGKVQKIGVRGGFVRCENDTVSVCAEI